MFTAPHPINCEKRLWLHLFSVFSSGSSRQQRRSPLSLLFSRLKRPSSLSISWMSCAPVPEQLDRPLLDSFRYVYDSHVLQSQEADTALQMHLTSAKQRGKITCCLLQPKRLLATFFAKMHCWLMVHQDLQVLQSCLPAGQPQHVLMHEVADPFQVWDFTPPFVKFHYVPLSPFLKPAHDPQA